MGVSLLESCFFFVRDSLLLESRVASLSIGSFKGGYGPNQEGVRKTTVKKNIDIAVKIAQGILDIGVYESSYYLLIRCRCNFGTYRIV